MLSKHKKTLSRRTGESGKRTEKRLRFEDCRGESDFRTRMTGICSEFRET